MSCATASARLGASEDYPLVARIRSTERGGVAIRATPRFPGLSDPSNLLGVAPVGASFAAQGPLKNPEHGNAVAFAVLVRDADGKTCRGYVSAGLVDVASPEVVRLTDQTQVASSIGRRVTLVAPLLTCRNPTVLGVDVAADPSDCGKVVQVTGELRTIVVESTPPVPSEEAIGARGPGTYYHLVDPADGTPSRARAVDR